MCCPVGCGPMLTIPTDTTLLIAPNLFIDVMDPLSITGSIIAVLQLSSKVVEYVTSATGATKERKRLRAEVRACESILQRLKDEADDSEEGEAWSETIRALEDPSAPLGRLRVLFGIVKAKLQPKEGAKKALASLKWPFNEKEMEKIFGAIEREKSLLQLASDNHLGSWCRRSKRVRVRIIGSLKS